MEILLVRNRHQTAVVYLQFSQATAVVLVLYKCCLQCDLHSNCRGKEDPLWFAVCTADRQHSLVLLHVYCPLSPISGSRSSKLEQIHDRRVTLMRARVSHPGLDLLLSSSLDNNHIITRWLILQSVYNCLILLFLTVLSPICHFKTLSFVAFLHEFIFTSSQNCLLWRWLIIYFISLGTCKEKCTVLLIRDISFDTTPVCQSGQSIQTFLSVSFSLQKIMLKVKPQDLLKSLYRWTMCIFVVRTYWMLVNNGNCCRIRVTCRLIAVLYQCIFFLRLTESTVQ